MPVQGISPSRLPGQTSQTLLRAPEINVYGCVAIQGGTPMERPSDMNTTAEAFSPARFLVEGGCWTSSVIGILPPFLGNAVFCYVLVLPLFHGKPELYRFWT